MGCVFAKVDINDPSQENNRLSTTTASSSGLPNHPNPKTGTSFSQFPIAEIRQATGNFSVDNLLSEDDQRASNMVFRGTFRGRSVAVKKLLEKDWPNRDDFEAEVKKIGALKLPGVTPLLGYCVEDSSRVLVAEFAENGTLSRNLFHYERQPMTLSQRINVAVKVCKTLHKLSKLGFPVYHDLNPYRVLLNEKLEPQLSCFGLIKAKKEGFSSNLTDVPPEYLEAGSAEITPESTVHSFGNLLLALLSGKRIQPTQFLHIAADKSSWSIVVDSAILNGPESETALELIPLVASCLNRTPVLRPTFIDMQRALEILDARSRGLLFYPSPSGSSIASEAGIAGADLATPPFGKAVEDGDMDQIHTLLAQCTYGTPPPEPSFENWNVEIQSMLNARKDGDKAFKAKKWDDAIKFYNLHLKLDTPKLSLLFARRSFSYLMIGEYNTALRDAMETSFVRPEWPEGYFLQAAALKRLSMEEDAKEMVVLGSRKFFDFKPSMSRSRSRSPSPRMISGVKLGR